jgi:hypothetical protein
MENEIINTVNKVINEHRLKSNSSNYIFWIDNFNHKDDIIKYVLSKSRFFNPNKGSFNGFFETITKSYMIILFHSEKEKIKLIMERESKLNQLGI